MTADLYPAATYEPVDYAADAAPMGTVLGWIEHVVVGDGDPWGTFEHAPSGSRRFSHLWFPKHGHRVEQYQLLSLDSWAQVGGNASYWSCETEGTPDEPLTDEQLDDLAAWHVWSGTADAIASLPGQRGIGTHSMGGAAWGGHACPGPIRAGQRAEILRRAAALRQGATMPRLDPADVELVADAVLAKLLAYAPPTGDVGSDGKPLTLPWVLSRDYGALKRIEATVDALTPKP